MPRATPLPLRRAIWTRFQRGQLPADIAQAVGLPSRTVRLLLRQWRLQGADDLAPHYRGGTSRSRQRQTVAAEVAHMGREHPTWGAGLIRVQLQRRHPRWTLPSVRALQRDLRQAGLQPAPRGRRHSLPQGRAQVPHDTWQMDAAEQVRLRSGQRVSWLRLIDECSGAVLKTVVFPPRPLEPSAGRRDATVLTGGVYRLGPAAAAAGR